MKVLSKIQMIKRIIISANILIVSLTAKAQDKESSLRQSESQLKEYFTVLYNSEKDQTIDSLNNLIIEIFSTVLKSKDSFAFKWDSLNMIGRLHSSDQKLNVYTWFVRNVKGSYSYYGFMQYNEGSRKKPEIRVYTLTDKSRGMKNPETLILSPDNWLGCVYFNIYVFTYRRDAYYTLLGYNFNNDFSDKKYIEQLVFDKKGVAVFGGEFQTEFQKVKRVILEYSSQLVASIRYDDKLQMIVFDHLSPFEPMFTGSYRFYGPDGSYDGYKFQKGEFLLRKDIDARNLQ
jgi:hypothetical protein